MICCGVACGFSALNNAAVPATWGAAILVPLSTAYSVPFRIESMRTCLYTS
jgi:hypothetical protein